MSGIEARETVEVSLRRELFGPLDGDPVRGKPLTINAGAVHFETKEESWGQFHDADSGQEILTSGTPLKRYGVGVLFAGASVGGSSVENAEEGFSDALDGATGVAFSEDDLVGPPVEIRGHVRHDVADSDDFDLTDANTFKPSAMAVSFETRMAGSGALTVKVTGARYEKLTVSIKDVAKPVDWWVRRPFEAVGMISGRTVLREINQLKIVDVAPRNGEGVAPLAVRVFSRPVPGVDDPTLRILTVAIVNDAPGSGPSSAAFQVGFKVTAVGDADIVPYPEVEPPDRDKEERSLDLLYRNQRTYAIGHGCAAEWGVVNADGVVPFVQSAALPAYEVVSPSPNVYLSDDSGNPVFDADGKRQLVSVSMAALASGNEDGAGQVELVLSQYEKWIERREAEIPELLPRYQDTASEHMRRARSALARMRTGWSLVAENDRVARAFRWANEAMLFQQVRSAFRLREVKQSGDGRWKVEGAHPSPTVPTGRGYWRPFQIAFLLTVLPELVEPERQTRSDVDLIFFPTGGGKTEAYLGAAAVSLLSRRLRNPEDAGTDTLMRYTLRLLTAQQFLRAATLVCVLEDICQRRLNFDPFASVNFDPSSGCVSSCPPLGRVV